MRALARRGQPEDRFNAAADRHDAAFLAALAPANDLYLRGGRENVVAALEAFDRDRADIEAGRRRGAAKLHGGGDAGMAHAYANAGAYVINLRLHPRERIAWMEDALASARATGNRQAEGNALGNLGIAHLNLGDARKAIEYHEQALNISREIGDRRVEGTRSAISGARISDSATRPTRSSSMSKPCSSAARSATAWVRGAILPISGSLIETWDRMTRPLRSGRKPWRSSRTSAARLRKWYADVWPVLVICEVDTGDVKMDQTPLIILAVLVVIVVVVLVLARNSTG